LKFPEAITEKIIVFWEVMLCNLVDRYYLFGGKCCLVFRLEVFLFYAENEGSTFLRWYPSSKFNDISYKTIIFKVSIVFVKI
jgi:hypothetical protein